MLIGSVHSTETKKKMRQAQLRNPTRYWLGKKRIDNILRNVLVFRGKPWSKARRKAQEKLTGFRVKRPVIKNGKEYSPDWHEIRKRIYARDNWICQECNLKCHNSTDKKIQCHHIDYNEKNNNSSNLITLCASCHTKTNFRREDWIKYYSNKRKEK